MPSDSSDMLNSLKSLLGDNADEKIRTVLESLGSASSSGSAPASVNTAEKDEETNPDIKTDSSAAPINLESLEYLGKLKSIANEIGNANDSRSELLMALRPFMRTERQKSIDTAIKLLNLSKFSGILNL